MKCGICGKVHSGTFYMTKRHGTVELDCLLDLLDKVLDKLDDLHISEMDRRESYNADKRAD
jgi:hypothetical protein